MDRNMPLRSEDHCGNSLLSLLNSDCQEMFSFNVFVLSTSSAIFLFNLSDGTFEKLRVDVFQNS